MTLKDRIKEGLEGKYQGLDNGFNRLNDVIFGIQKRCYMLLGGNSGCYKTTLVDYMLFNALEDAKKKGIKLHVFYYSFEIDRITKQCNWLAQHISKKYNTVISPETIKGLGKNRLSIQQQALVDAEVEYIEELFDEINFRFSPINPTGIYKDLWNFGETNGTILREEYSTTDENGKVYRDKRIIGYIPNDPNAYYLVIMDHMALMRKERGYQTKEIIDKYSEYCNELRNLFGFSFINIQQFNSSLSSVERLKFKGVDLSPQQSDFKDSTNPFQDCDIALGVMCPYKLDLEKSLGYEVDKLQHRLIQLKVIKNRLSIDNVAVGLFAKPESGQFLELPPASQINYSNYKI